MSFRFSLCSLILGVAICSSAATVETNVSFVSYLKSINVEPYIDQPTHNFHNKDGNANIHRLFDGRTWSSDGTTDIYRWIDSIHKYGTNVWAAVAMPRYLRRHTILRGYQLHRLSYWASNKRAPVEWYVYGMVMKGGTETPEKWIELDHRDLGANYWSSFPDNAPQDEVNFFSVSNNIAFEKYRFVFINSAHSLAGTYDGAENNWFDIGLNEVELFVDLVPGADTQISSDILPQNAHSFSGEFYPLTESMILSSQTITAPAWAVSNGVVYRCTGFRTSRKEENGSWKKIAETAAEPYDEQHVCGFYTHEFDPLARPIRVKWQWEPTNQNPDGECISFSSVITAAGNTLGNCTSGNAGMDPLLLRNLFDGVTFQTKTGTSARYDTDPRYLAKISESPWSRLVMPEGTLLPQDEFLLSSYRVYPLSLFENERKRAPTAWTLSITNTATTGWTVCDTQSNVDWTSVPFFTRNENYLEFPLPESVPITGVTFTPTDSAGYQTNLLNQTTEIDIGMMEVLFLGNIVNPAGSLRIRAPEMETNGFSHADGTLLTSTATLSAPARGRLTGSMDELICRGYLLERFDADTRTWVVDQTSTNRTYAFTPDASARLRLTWLFDREKPYFKITAQSEGNETVTVSPASDDGYHIAGEVITLTANPRTDDLTSGGGADRYHSTFVRWTGDLAGLTIDPTQPVITFPVDRTRALVPIFDSDWIFYTRDLSADGGTGTETRLRNTTWEIAATKSGNGAITVNQWRSGAGRLNFDTKIYDATTGEELHIYRFNDFAFGDSANIMNRLTLITDLTLPRSVTSIANNVFRFNNITNVVIDCPLLETLGTAVFARNFDIDRVVLKTPNLVKLPGSYHFYGARYRDTDLETWDLSSVTNIPFEAFTRKWWEATIEPAYAGHGGVLTLPSVQAIGAGAFESFIVASAFILGSENGRVTSISNNAFLSTRASLFEIAAASGMTVAENAFSDAGAPETFRFTAEPPGQTALERMLLSNSETEKANVYVSKIRKSWQDWIVWTDQITNATVQAEAKTAGAVGAFQTSAGVWKALVFAELMPFDPRGTLLLIH